MYFHKRKMKTKILISLSVLGFKNISFKYSFVKNVSIYQNSPKTIRKIKKPACRLCGSKILPPLYVESLQIPPLRTRSRKTRKHAGFSENQMKFKLTIVIKKRKKVGGGEEKQKQQHKHHAIHA